jgi:hypothetical protein
VKVVEFVVLWSLEDRYRHRHVRIEGRVVEFMVQYEIRLESGWAPVVRYDTAHGFAHRDLFSQSGKSVKTPLGFQDLNRALTFAEADLKANWRWYRQRYPEGAV